MRQVIYYHGHRYTRRTQTGILSNRPVLTVLVHRQDPDRTKGFLGMHLVSERSHYGIPFRAKPEDTGCYVDGHWGNYAVAHMVNRSEEFGYDQPEVIALADRHMASMGPSGTEGLTDDEHETLIDASDDVESWLNEHIAPEGYSFGWWEGEFFLWSDEWWEETP
jgi:hypothetical protein